MYLILIVALMLVILPAFWRDHEACRPLEDKPCRICGGPAALSQPDGQAICLSCYAELRETRLRPQPWRTEK